MIRVRLSGDSLDGLADRIFEDVRPLMEKAAVDGAEMIVARAKSLLSRPNPGGEPASRTVAFRTTAGRDVMFESQKSRPTGAPAGEAPYLVSGELRDSLQVFPAKWSKYSLRVPYGSLLEWAGRMEFGGKDAQGRYLPPHPYLRPAEDQTRDAVETRLESL